jgi:hypothetical protein
VSAGPVSSAHPSLAPQSLSAPPRSSCTESSAAKTVETIAATDAAYSPLGANPLRAHEARSMK